jgi:hypothetical protein
LIVASSMASIVFLLFLSLANALGQKDYLVNGGFEEGTAGWTASSVTSFVAVTTPVSSGTWAACLGDLNAESEIRIHQEVPVFPGATYTLTGWAYNDEPTFYRVCLRLEWLPSIWTKREACLVDESDFYRPLTIGPLVAPSSATGVRISALAEMIDPDPTDPVYFDEISLTCSLTPRQYLPLLSKKHRR